MTHQSLGHASGNRQCLGLCAVAAVNAAVISMLYCVQPLLPILSSDYGGDAMVALLPAAALAGYGAGVLGTALLPGAVTDPRSMGVHLLLLVVALCAAAAASGIAALALSHAAIGVGGAFAVRATACAVQMVPDARRAWALGIAIAGGLSGLAAARAGAFGLAGVLGGWREVYCVGAFAVATSGAMLLLATRHGHGPVSTRADHRPSPWRHPGIRAVAQQQAASFAAFNAAWVAFLSDATGGPGVAVVSVAGAAAALSSGWLCGRLGADVVARVGITALAASTLLLCTDVAPWWPCMLLLDVGVQAALVANQARVQALDPSAGGHTSALVTACGFGGAALGAAAAHLMVRHGGPTAAFALAATAGASALLLERGGAWARPKLPAAAGQEIDGLRRFTKQLSGVADRPA